jgi:outer membrane protein TolC
LLGEAKLRAAAGLVGPNQVANARVFLAEQEQAVLDQEERLDRGSDRLGTLMGRRPGAGQSRYRPVQEPPRDFPSVDQDSLVALALRRNHELRAVERQVAAAKERARRARWNILPSLDLLGAVGGTGLAGTGREVIFGADTLRTDVSGGFGESWAQVRGRDFPTWSIGVEFSLPLGNRSAGGEHDRLRAEVVKAQQRLVAARRAVEEEVRAQHRELMRGQLRLSLAKDGVDASYEQVRIGLLEYKSGRTTAFELVRLGADLAAAQQRYSEALVRTAKAAAELRHLTAAGYPDLAGKEERL